MNENFLSYIKKLALVVIVVVFIFLKLSIIKDRSLPCLFKKSSTAEKALQEKICQQKLLPTAIYKCSRNPDLSFEKRMEWLFSILCPGINALTNEDRMNSMKAHCKSLEAKVESLDQLFEIIKNYNKAQIAFENNQKTLALKSEKAKLSRLKKLLKDGHLKEAGKLDQSDIQILEEFKNNPFDIEKMEIEVKAQLKNSIEALRNKNNLEIQARVQTFKIFGWIAVLKSHSPSLKNYNFEDPDADVYSFIEKNGLTLAKIAPKELDDRISAIKNTATFSNNELMAFKAVINSVRTFSKIARIFAFVSLDDVAKDGIETLKGYLKKYQFTQPSLNELKRDLYEKEEGIKEGKMLTELLILKYCKKLIITKEELEKSNSSFQEAGKKAYDFSNALIYITETSIEFLDKVN